MNANWSEYSQILSKSGGHYRNLNTLFTTSYNTSDYDTTIWSALTLLSKRDRVIKNALMLLSRCDRSK